MDEKKSTQLRRLTALCLGVVFLLVVVAATVYSQTGYVERLPLVTLAPIDWMVVPNEALYVNDDGGYRLYYVEQEDGPWGKRYILREWVVTGQRPDDENHTVVYEIEELPYPVITSLSAGSRQTAWRYGSAHDRESSCTACNLLGRVSQSETRAGWIGKSLCTPCAGILFG